ncbi:MAG: glycosyltransferase family 4 protein [Clostridiaceae bacterium]|nr:glycosyltransferase family 4 protein [Clostridiaceae bacterium]
MNVAVLSQQDPYNRKTFSGTSYSLSKQLEKHFNVCWINPNNRVTGLLSRYFNRTKKGRFILNQNPLWVSKLISKNFNRLLNKNKIDVVFNIGMAGPFTAYKNKAKIITFADASMKQMIEYHYDIKESDAQAITLNEAMEKTTFELSDVIITTSQWCSDSIINDYSINPKKIELVPVGANIQIDPEYKSPPEKNTIHLLFVGIDPVGKGLAIAAEAVAKLNELDQSKAYILDVVGLSSAEGIAGEHIKFHGFLNKNITEEEKQLKDFYRNSDLFILPTRLDTIGIVFLEASSYGLPILTCDTGGVPEYVINNETGYLLPLSASGADFAKKALELLNDPIKYTQISRRAVELIKTKYNWDVWGERVAEIIKNLY